LGLEQRFVELGLELEQQLEQERFVELGVQLVWQ
jgi:hypothetical protein